MNRTVYFADRAVAFTAEAPGGAWYAVAAEACGGISRAKILNFLESHNSVAVVSDDPDRAFAAFAAEFTPVEAAGGVVVNDCGEWLMIHRNGRWDLPKGHLAAGERLAACAEREIAEETGDQGAPGPLDEGEQGLGRQPAARQARGLAQRRQRLGEDARDERAAVPSVRRAGDEADC